MKKLIIILVVISSCSPQKKEVVYDNIQEEWLDYEYSIVRGSFKPNIEFYHEKCKIVYDSVNSNYRFYSKKSGKDSINEFLFDIQKQIVKSSFDSDYENYEYVSTKTVFCNDKEYKIYKYILNTEIIDSGELLFFSPEYGIICRKSTAWPNYITLIGNSNKDDAKIISQLNTTIFYDKTFFSGRIFLEE